VVLAAVHAALWYYANLREGVWRQVPATDQAHDLTTAWIIHRAFANLDPDGVVKAWIHGSSVHTPFVPFLSALLMTAFGKSRLVAELVLPISTAVWLTATYAVIRRRYDSSTARWTTALVSTFPVFLIYSRTYLFDHPLAAVFAVACWALLATDRLERIWPSVAFGVLAGLTS
jgi:4-amino-4-deoxy-L-arabinose transferase-like glycosyltransferase